MNIRIACALSALGIAGFTGCTGSFAVKGNDEYAAIATMGREHRAVIALHIESGTAEYEGDFVSVQRDSVRWLDPATRSRRAAATENVRSIRFINRLSGAAIGAAIGAAPGGALLILNTAQPNGGDASGVRAALQNIGLVGMIGGAIIGGVIGALVGHAAEYTFGMP